MKAFLAVALALIAAPAAASEVAITFDDLPVHSALPPGESRLGVAARILGALADAKTPPVYGFVNAAGVGTEPGTAEVLKVWRAAGHPLGNHTWSHMRLEDPKAFEAEIASNEPTLRREMAGQDWKWLRYPYLEEGQAPAARTHVRQYLQRHGYKVASVTMSFDDYAWNEPYARCAAKGDTAAIAELEARYMAAIDANLAHVRALSQKLYGREIPYVLLMHVGAFSARMMPRMMQLYAGRGVRFVSLEQAMADPFYDPDRRAEASPKPTTLEDVARARGVAFTERPWMANGLDKVCR